TLREGNREEFDGQFDFNLAGVGFQGEGPLAGGNGSWMFSARRSFLDLIFAAVDPGAVQVPEYSDYQGKIAFDLSETQKLSLLGIWGVDAILSDSAGAFDNRIDVYGDIGIHEGAIGMNLRSLWPGAVSNTSLAYGENYWSVLMFRTTGGQSLMENVTTERWFSFRNVNSVDIGHGGNVLSFGAEVKHNFADYNVVFPAFVNFTGDSVAERTFVTDLTGQNIGGYVEFHLKPASGLAVTIGARGDHYTVTGNTHLSPRGSITFSLTDRTSITASTGLYYQDLPSVLLAQDPAFRNLEPPRSIHYVLGLSHLLTDDTRLMVEAYRKDVSRMPIDPLAPGMFVFDEVILGANTFLNHPTLTDVGEARSMGVELTVQKRLARDLYGLASASYSIAEYLGGDAIWRDRIYDNRLRIGFEGGYKPNEKWEFSGRWLFATGAPYTPIDTVQSAVHKWTVLDDTNVNGARYPNYHSLNLRFDRRFNYRRTNMVLFLSIWNVYNRQNVGAYFWNGIDNEVTTFYQWTMLPILGIEFEF
ncbi:MAG: TonB-dependent receptor, partial [Gemmatimonadota bacterium]|nr:TonB-dependent receptor [Gemmatimonadota bacterium]